MAFALSQPKPPMLVETEWLAKHGESGYVRIIDMRALKDYEAGHIPQAIHLDERSLRNEAERDTYLPMPEKFAKQMGEMGVSGETHVVVYDDQGGRSAARLWYVLNAFGHTRVSLLNGGWQKWKGEGRPATAEIPPIPQALFVPKPVPSLSCPSPELLARKPGVVVLDSRSPKEFDGSELTRGADRAGRLPGSVNVEWKEAVTGPYMVFKSAQELKRLFAQKGITPEREIVALCGTGGRAAHTLFTLKMLGFPKVRVYYGSFLDYIRRPDSPLEKP
jgi:thiosulfate/3-mercaptopyruvate sulfurtransferase